MDRARVLLRLVAAVPSQLHLPERGVRVWELQLRVRLERCHVQLLIGSVPDRLRCVCGRRQLRLRLLRVCAWLGSTGPGGPACAVHLRYHGTVPTRLRYPRNVRVRRVRVRCRLEWPFVQLLNLPVPVQLQRSRYMQLRQLRLRPWLVRGLLRL